MCDLILLEQAVRQNVINLEKRLSILVLRFTALHFENVDLKKEICNTKDQNAVLTSQCAVLESQGRSLHRHLTREAKAMDPKHSTRGSDIHGSGPQDAKGLEAGQHSPQKLPKATTKTPSGLGGNTVRFHIASDTASAEATPQIVGLSTSRQPLSRSLSRSLHSRNVNSLIPSESPPLQSPNSKRHKTT